MPRLLVRTWCPVAARMPQVPRDVVKDRARRLRAHGEAALARHLDREIGSVRRVLAESDDAGHTEHFTPVWFAHAVNPGQIVDSKMISHDGRRLTAVSREGIRQWQATDRATIS